VSTTSGGGLWVEDVAGDSSLNHQVSERVLPTLCTFSPSLAMNSSSIN
jgi:hypothetical protein